MESQSNTKDNRIIISIIILVIIVIVGIIIAVILINNKKGIKCVPKNTKTKLYYNQNDCKYILNSTIIDILDEYNITKDKDDYNIYFPCLYDDIDDEIENIKIKKDVKYFMIDNCDRLAAKESLWNIVSNRYTKEETLKLMPQTYVLYDEADRKKLFTHFDDNKLYILKKNIQRQNGILILNDITNILSVDRTYVVAQELLQNPYLIDRRKINLRVYVLIICDKSNINISMYNDGFMYYTEDYYEPNTTDLKKNITTGYIDRYIYEINPLTHNDFKIYLDKNREITQNEIDIRMKGNKLSEYAFTNIRNMLSKVFSCFVNQVYLNPKMQNNMCFQLFGVDVALDDKLDAKIMEINKGPDLGSKDKRDSEIKHNLVRNLFNKIDLVKTDCPNEFIELVDYNRLF
jgi:hypothetical protein